MRCTRPSRRTRARGGAELAQGLQRALAARLLHHHQGHRQGGEGAEQQSLVQAAHGEVEQRRQHQQQEHRLAQHRPENAQRTTPRRLRQGIGSVLREAPRRLRAI